MGVVSRRRVWLVGEGEIYGCGCKEVYRFPHTTYPYSSCICSFLQQHPYFLFIFLMFFVLVRIKKKNAISQFFTLHVAYVNLHYIAMLYTHGIGNQL